MSLTAYEGLQMQLGQVQSAGRLVTVRVVGLMVLLIGCETQRLVSDPGDALARLEISPVAVTMQKDEVADFQAAGFSASGDSVEIGVTWAASGGTMVSQSTVGRRHDGRYRAGQACGSYAVIATGAPGDVADTASISIVCAPAPVASVAVAPASASISVGATQQLTATPQAADGSALVGRAVTWETSAPGIATVSQQGLVTAITAGSATITATSEGKSGSSAITVTAPVASVDVAPASASIAVSATQQLTATVKAADGSALPGRTVTWATSASGIATVNAQGLVTGITAGSATITATSEGKSGSSAITVTGGGQSNLITDPSLVFTVPAISKPDYLTPIRPSPFGTKITRIAGNSGQSLTTTNGSGTWGSDVRHHSSKDQPWNSTGTLIHIENKGSPRVLFLDGETYAPKFGPCSNYDYYEDRWHPSREHPNERINVKGSQLIWFDVVSCVKTRSWTLPVAVPGIGPWEGNPSADGRFVALTDSTRFFVVDMDPQPPFAPYPSSRIGPMTDLTDCGIGSCTIDWVSVSPSGKYVVVSYDGDYVRVYDVNPGTLALTPRPMPLVHANCHGTAAKGFIYDLGHADMALNPFDNNEDVLIGQEHCGNRGSTVSGVLVGGVMMVRLRDGAIKPLTHPSNEAYPYHISTRNYDRPGWAYVTYWPAAGKRFNDEIIAVRMDGSFAVERLAHTRSNSSGCYRCEPHGVPSRDGKRVIFASNWGSSTLVQGYVVDTR